MKEEELFREYPILSKKVEMVEKKATNGQKRLKSIWNKNPFTNYDFANRIEFPLRECLHFGCVSTNFSSLP